MEIYILTLYDLRMLYFISFANRMSKSISKLLLVLCRISHMKICRHKFCRWSWKKTCRLSWFTIGRKFSFSFDHLCGTNICILLTISNFCLFFQAFCMTSLAVGCFFFGLELPTLCFIHKYCRNALLLLSLYRQALLT